MAAPCWLPAINFRKPCAKTIARTQLRTIRSDLTYPGRYRITPAGNVCQVSLFLPGVKVAGMLIQPLIVPTEG